MHHLFIRLFTEVTLINSARLLYNLALAFAKIISII